MTDFLIYPAINGAHQFPSEVNQAIADSAELTASFASVGPIDPAPSLPPGTEYVWNKTDGAGTLLDIVTGVA